jgi:nucleoid-associated protein YgaU
MHCRIVCILLFTCFLLISCSAPEPTWRSRVTSLVTELSQQDTPRLFPQEFKNLVETFEHGEAVLHVQEDEAEADNYYLLALQKGELLKAELKVRKELLAQQERKMAAEKAARAKEERIMREAAAAEERLHRQLRSKADEETRAAVAAKSIAMARERQPTSYTVHRGETLPQIAARSEIYNDASLWPIIYRANRDQIRDPKQLWPGQALKIPRHFSHDEVVEAKRYSGKN